MNRRQCTEREIKEFLFSYISNLLNVDKESIDSAKTFTKMGLDSSSAVGLTGDLQSWLECELDSAITFDYPSIDQLSKYLSMIDENQ